MLALDGKRYVAQVPRPLPEKVQPTLSTLQATVYARYGRAFQSGRLPNVARLRSALVAQDSRARLHGNCRFGNGRDSPGVAVIVVFDIFLVFMACIISCIGIFMCKRFIIDAVKEALKEAVEESKKNP